MQIANSLSCDHRVCRSYYFWGLQLAKIPGKSQGTPRDQSLPAETSAKGPTPVPCFAQGIPATQCRSATSGDIDSKAMFFLSFYMYFLTSWKATEGCCCLGSQMKRAERKHSIHCRWQDNMESAFLPSFPAAAIT